MSFLPPLSNLMHMNKVLFMILLFAMNVRAQAPDQADYARAVSFLWENLNNKKVFKLHVTPNWFADSSGVWFVEFAETERTYSKVTFKPFHKSNLFDHGLLAEKLAASTSRPVDPKNLELTDVRYINRDELEFSMAGRKFKWNTRSSALEQIERLEEPRNLFESKSPDANWIAYSEAYNLFVRSAKTGETKQLSTRGRKDYEYASYYGWSDIIEGEQGERPKRFAANWSPDSKWIQTSICDLRYGQKMYLLDWSVDTLHRARLLSYYRGSPGDTSVVHLEGVVFNALTGEERRLPMPRIAHENGYAFRWSDKPGIGFLSYRERGFQKAHLILVDLNTGIHRTLFTDSSKTNTDGFEYWISEKANKVVVGSERNGWRQLYTIDLNTYQVKPLTIGNYFVNNVVHIDATREGTVYFLASGKEPGRNPYQQYLYSISLSGKGLKLLTPEEGNHDISLSPDGRFVFDNYSSTIQPTTTVLRELRTGKVVMEISKAEVSKLLGMGWKTPQPFSVTGKDGSSTIYGLLWKPSDFDPTKKYPVIDNSYTGPHTQIVPRTYVRVLNTSNQALAELGFVVMMVDGLGTYGRSRAFRDASYKRLGFGLEDHVLALRQLARQHAWLDTTRVGIFGHSAGGYDAAHALLQFPEFYKVGVASSADHDHRMEKAWWPEMYMGWPVDSAYHLQSNITMAGRLKGKLLITHGGIDENVNPSATFKLAEYLVRADKQFDMLIFPSMRHGYTGAHQRYFTKVRWNYFVRHLLGAEPLWEIDLR